MLYRVLRFPREALPALSSDDLLRAIDETALSKGWENRSGNGTSERGGKREGK